MNFTLISLPWGIAQYVTMRFTLTLPVTVANVNHLNFIYIVHNQHFSYMIIPQMALKTGWFQFILWIVTDDNKNDYKKE